MTNQLSQDKRLLSIETSLGKDQLILTRLACDESLSDCYQIQLTVFSKKPTKDIQSLIHQTVSMAIHDEKQPIRYFHGVVNAIQLGEADKTGYRCYRLTVSPDFWQLTLRSNCRNFQKQTVVSILETIMAEHKLTTPNEKGLSKKYPEIEYVAQYNETDFHFVSRLLAAAGIYYYFEMSKNQHRLVLIDDIQRLPKYNQAVTFSHDHVRGKQIYQWNDRERIAVNCVEMIADNESEAKNPINGIYPLKPGQQQRHSSSSVNIVRYPGTFKTIQAGEQQAQKLHDQVAWQAHQNTAQSVYEAFHAGICFDFQPKNTDKKQTYYITHIHHEAEDNTHRADPQLRADKQSQRYSNTFKCVADIYPYVADVKPLAALPVQTATVVAPAGRPMYTNKQGQIKVQFKWDREHQHNEQSSSWMSVMQSQMGKQWGQQFIPRDNQEVMVGYYEGNVSRPMVMGSLYNGDNAPPYDLPKQQHLSGIKTRSMGSQQPDQTNELQFNDQANAEAITFNAQKDLVIDMLQDEQVIVENNLQMQVKQGKQQTQVGNTAVLLSNQSITLQAGNGQITMTPNSISILGQLVNINPGPQANVAIPIVAMTDDPVDSHPVTYVDVIYDTYNKTFHFLTAEDVLRIAQAEKPYQDAAKQFQQAQQQLTHAKRDKYGHIPQAVKDTYDAACEALNKQLIGHVKHETLAEIVKLSGKINGKGWGYLPVNQLEKILKRDERDASVLKAKVEKHPDGGYVYTITDHKNKGYTEVSKTKTAKQKPVMTTRKKLSVTDAKKVIQNLDPEKKNIFSFSTPPLDKSLFDWSKSLEKNMTIDKGSTFDALDLEVSTGARIMRFSAGAGVCGGFNPNTQQLVLAGSAQASFDVFNSHLNAKATFPAGVESYDLKDTMGDDTNPVDFGFFKFDLNLLLYEMAGASVMACGDINIGPTAGEEDKSKTKNLALPMPTSVQPGKANFIKGQFNQAVQSAVNLKNAVKQKAKTLGPGLDAQVGAFVGVAAGCDLSGTMRWASPESVKPIQNPNKNSEKLGGLKGSGVPQWTALADLSTGVEGDAGAGAKAGIEVSYHGQKFVITVQAKVVFGAGAGGKVQIGIDAKHIEEFTKFVYHQLKDFNFSQKQIDVFMNAKSMQQYNFILIAAMWSGTKLVSYAENGFERVINWFSININHIVYGSQAAQKILQLARNINSNSQFVFYLPPQAKGNMLYHLSYFYQLYGGVNSGSDEVASAIQKIILLVQNVQEWLEVLKNVTAIEVDSHGIPCSNTVGVITGQKILLNNLDVDDFPEVSQKISDALERENAASRNQLSSQELLMADPHFYQKCVSALRINDPVEQSPDVYQGIHGILTILHLISKDLRSVSLRRQHISRFTIEDKQLEELEKNVQNAHRDSDQAKKIRQIAEKYRWM